MTTVETCSACGSDISEAKFKAGEAIRHGAKLYCNDCGKLILSPEELAAGRIKPAEPEAAPPVPAPAEKAPPRFGGRGLKRGRFKRPTRMQTRSAAGSAGPAERISKRSSARGSKRSSKESSRESDKSGKAKAQPGLSSGAIIGIAVGGLALLVIIIASVGGGGTAGSRKSDAENSESARMQSSGEVFNDKTPSEVYARRAEEEAAKGNKSEAVRLLGKAADKAEHDGSPNQARNYNMRATDIMKSSKIYDH